MKFHTITNIFPMMSEEEFTDLMEDIKKHGLRETIWTWKGEIVDGRNRYLACTKAGIEPQLREWDGEGSLVEFVVSLNLHRRHLSQSQKAMISENMLPFLEEEAKERKRLAGILYGRGGHSKDDRKVTQKIGEPIKGQAGDQTANPVISKFLPIVSSYISCPVLRIFIFRSLAHNLPAISSTPIYNLPNDLKNAHDQR
ncbi:hypothetical protein BMS3Bbin15_00062 [archaeon BMS3Bbin15]|nr:hypothetical protein BMS3Bbin15_00062 [archaeon BMS3Bbin15]